MFLSTKGLCVDKDGTIVKQGTALEGAIDFLNGCSVPFVVASNTGVRDTSEVHEDLERHGLRVDHPPNAYIRTAAQDLAKLLNERDWREGEKLVVVSPRENWRGLLSPLLLPRLVRLEEAKEEPSCSLHHLAIFSDGKLCDGREYDALSSICTLASRGCTLYFSSSDSCLVASDGSILPGPGSVLASVRSVVPNAKVVVAGKGGETSFFNDCISLLRGIGFEGQARNVLFVGDRLDTDMLAGRVGMQTCLVETGCNTERDAVLSTRSAVHHVASSLADIPIPMWSTNPIHYVGVLLRSRFCSFLGSDAVPIVSERARRLVPPRRVWSTGDLAKMGG